MGADKTGVFAPYVEVGELDQEQHDAVRDVFFSNMSERAGKMLKEEIASLGPIRLRDVDDAQMLMVQTAKDLSAKGEIVLADNKGDDELVY